MRGTRLSRPPDRRLPGRPRRPPGLRNPLRLLMRPRIPRQRGFSGRQRRNPRRIRANCWRRRRTSTCGSAEYDNYRKRTAKEKENAWSEAKAQTVAAFLPVYDNLERALKQETADEAYKKGVEMTMKGLQDALTGLGVEVIPALGETFDPNRHNAVMHCDDEEAGESTIVEVFQQGFICGEKVIRFSMVKVAN